MTQDTLERVVGASPAGRTPERRPAGPALRATGAALSILAVLLLAFVANLGPLGDLRHGRDQKVAHSELRGELANATAPVGPRAQNGEPLEPGTPIALLEIPQLGLRTVIGEGTTSEVLAAGPGHRRDTVFPGQPGVSIVMGRQAAYGGPFAHLDEVRAGETFTVTTGQGRHTYRVLGVRREGDPQPPVLGAGQGRLTLITGDGRAFLPGGLLRVDADLVSAVQPGAAPLYSTGSLPADEKPMALQTSAWLPLVLWGQALVLAAAVLTWIRVRSGRREAWVVGVPVLGALGFAVADQAALLLPNLL
ncbi:sortase [Streptomyces sp. GMY02]|uniref:sortase n=1 Tax=Streptomyces sp. GMY02 TaxID=1333528 RepID=UPI001C2C22AD|nr:sortase [Streptomyces sp. GMY02]QXE34686.1 sortase [Streptomyces sp. GMY02]